MPNYTVQVWSRRVWLTWGRYSSAWVAQAVQWDREYRDGMAARVEVRDA